MSRNMLEVARIKASVKEIDSLYRERKPEEGRELLEKLNDDGDIDFLIEGIEEMNEKPTIGRLCLEAFKIATSKGWHEKESETGTMLALIHSEVSEALEADRKGDEENFVEELADVCIRVFDLCGSRGLDLEEAIKDKMEFNKRRAYKHGNKKY